MASNSDNNLLIDFEASSTVTSSTADISVRSKRPDESVAGITNSTSLFQSSTPLYKLLDSHGLNSLDFGDNNPFDCMMKQSRLLDDPFEIVENAAKANPVATVGQQHVKTGTLISLDSLESPSSVSAMNQPEIINISSSPSSNDNSSIESNSVKQTNASVQADSEIVTPPSATTQNAFVGTVQNMSTPMSRCSSKTKSSALHLLKFSLSNNRMDSTSDNGSPIPTEHESSSGDDHATILHKKMMHSKELMLRTPGSDDSFDDLSATKPNWIDSETDIENDSDLDNDIAKLSIPMLAANISSEKDGAMDTDATATGSDENAPKSKELNASLSRDKLMEKLASIKLKAPSPKSDDEGKDGDIKANCDVPLIEIGDRNDVPDSGSARSSNSVSPSAQEPESTDALIAHLKKFVDQCDDKEKQTEAKSLLKNLSSILTHGGERAAVPSDRSSSSFELTPPQPIVRQGTFSIDRGVDDKQKSTSSNPDANVTPKNSHELKPKAAPKSAAMDPALSQILKDLQNVLGPNPCVNVVKTNGQPQTSEVNNPTYIVVMNAPSNDTVNFITPHRPNRSRSFSSCDRPVAVIRAAQAAVEQRQQQTPVATAAPMRRPPFLRRSSFGSITRLPPNEPAAAAPKPSAPIMRRRSFQGPVPTSSIRPPSPKPVLKSTMPTRPVNDTVSLKRRPSLNSSVVAPPKDSPSKIKSSYGIIKKPQAPPLVRNLKIRVKESLTGRSSAPMRAVVPMGRVAPLVVINESVTPMNGKPRQRLATSTPRPLHQSVPISADTSIHGKSCDVEFPAPPHDFN